MEVFAFKLFICRYIVRNHKIHIYYSSSSSLSFNATTTHSTKEKTLFNTLKQCWTVSRCQTSAGNMVVLLIFIDWMPFLAPTLENADPLFNMMITLRFISASHRGGGSRSS